MLPTPKYSPATWEFVRFSFKNKGRDETVELNLQSAASAWSGQAALAAESQKIQDRQKVLVIRVRKLRAHSQKQLLFNQATNE